MEKKLLTGAIIGCVVVAVVTIAIIIFSIANGYLFAQEDDYDFYSDSVMYRIGRAHRDIPPNSEIYVQGNGFVIYDYEIQRINIELYLTDNQDNWYEAVQNVIRREVLFLEAQGAGFYATDDEVREWIAGNVEQINEAENIYDFNMYLLGRDMTIEEYFESMFEVLRKEIATGKFSDFLYFEWINENLHHDVSEHIMREMWFEYWNGLVYALMNAAEYEFVG